MRKPSEEHVTRCEGATTPPTQCRCRCGGKCHGRALVAQGAGREAFEALPADDPHHLHTAADERASQSAQARTRRARHRAERLERDRRAFVERVRGRNPSYAAELEARWFAPAG